MYAEWRITVDVAVKLLRYFYPSVISLLTRSVFPIGEKYKINKKMLESIEA